MHLNKAAVLYTFQSKNLTVSNSAKEQVLRRKLYYQQVGKLLTVMYSEKYEQNE